MPFFNNLIYVLKNYKNKKDCASLQVQRRIPESIFIRKRVFLFTSCKVSASLTIEAAMTTAVIIYILFAIVNFMVIFNSEISMQINMNNIARETSKGMFYLDTINKAADMSDNEFLKKINNKIVSTFSNSEQDDSKIDENIKNITEKSYVYGKIIEKSGAQSLLNPLVDMTKSSIDFAAGDVDIIACYNCKYPFFGLGSATVLQRAKMKGWIGEDIQSPKEIVYTTPTGDVYHTNKNCSYLKVNIKKADYKDLENLRTASGAKYKMCERCGKVNFNPYSQIYISENGDCYHADINCTSISRGIITIDKSQIGDRSLCSKCEKE